MNTKVVLGSRGWIDCLAGELFSTAVSVDTGIRHSLAGQLHWDIIIVLPVSCSQKLFLRTLA